MVICQLFAFNEEESVNMIRTTYPRPISVSLSFDAPYARAYRQQTSSANSGHASSRKHHGHVLSTCADRAPDHEEHERELQGPMAAEYI